MVFEQLYSQVVSLRAVSNENGNTVKEIVYDTFGNIISDSNETLKIPFGFAGGLQDKDTKLIHFGFREYDPFIGRWTAKDPILFAGGDSNLYGYVLGDPVGGIDPEGKSLLSTLVTVAITGYISYQFYDWIKKHLFDSSKKIDKVTKQRKNCHSPPLKH